MKSWSLEHLNFLFRGLIVQGVASLGLWFFWTWEVHLDMHQAKTSTLIVQGKTSKLGHYQGNLPTLAGINLRILIEYFPCSGEDVYIRFDLWYWDVLTFWVLVENIMLPLLCWQHFLDWSPCFYYWVLTKVHPYVVNSLIVWLAKWKISLSFWRNISH